MYLLLDHNFYNENHFSTPQILTMKKINTLFFLPIFIIFSCTKPVNKGDSIEKWKSEILQTEKAFNDLAQQEGITKAFNTYAAEEGVINRGGKLIAGNQAITEWYQKYSRPNETLTWKPDYVHVSSSGGFAYTYGGYVFTSIDSAGYHML